MEQRGANAPPRCNQYFDNGAATWPPGVTNPREPSLPTWAYRMRVDATAARTLGALKEAGVPAVLLKGSTLGDLYDDRSPRSYIDVDVLVPYARLADAEAALGRLS